MNFLTISTLANAFHHASKFESKQKGKPHFTTKPIGQTSNKKLPADSNKSRKPSQMTPPNPYYHNNHYKKYKGEHSKQPPIEKWCYYINSSWQDTLECND